VTVREILDDAALRLGDGLAAEVEAALRLTIGGAYRGLGRSSDGERELRRALAIADALGAPERVEIRRQLGLLYIDAGRLTEAEALVDEALTASPPGGSPLARARALDALGTLRDAQARFDDAERAFRDAIALADAAPAAAAFASELRIALGEVLQRAGRPADAERVVVEARARAEADGARGLSRVLRADSVLALL